MHRTFLAAAAVLALAAAPASATEWIHCNDAADQVQVGLLAGFFEFLDVTRATLRVGEENWSTSPAIEPGTPMDMGSKFGDSSQMLVDLEDEASGETLAELRVFKADESVSGHYVQGGTLSVVGRGAWVVSCDGW
jgi:hypothetical protein